MEFRQFNWPGLACSIAAAILVILSVFYAAPWWQMSIGDGLGHLEISPLDYNANLAGIPIEIPIIWFLNIGGKLTLVSCAVAMFLHSMIRRHPSSKQLLGFAYKKPLFMLLLFVIMLGSFTMLLGSFFGVYVPVIGVSTLSLSAEGATVNIPIVARITKVFWLATLTATLALAAKIYDWKIRPPPLP